MTDKELRRLGKNDLLWLLRDQEEEIQELKARLARLEADAPDAPDTGAGTAPAPAADEG